MRGDLAAITMLISVGAVIGKLNVFQLFVLTVIESFFYSLNDRLVNHTLGAADVGGNFIFKFKKKFKFFFFF